VSGAASALTGTATSIMMGVADMPIQTLKLLNIHPDARAASKKGKERAATSSEDASNTGDPSRPGRPTASRTATSAESMLSGESTPPTSRSPMPDIKSPDGPGSPSHRSQFMAEAFSASAQKSRSPSRDRGRLCSPDGSGHSRKNSVPGSNAPARSNTGTSNFADNLKNMQVDSAVDTGKGLARIVGAGFKSPMDFSLNVAKGFHNVPKLYGGEVRKVDNVTDFKSGLSTAAKVATSFSYILPHH
jgi:hypothetical protein